jgi:hypothetical protein
VLRRTGRRRARTTPAGGAGRMLAFGWPVPGKNVPGGTLGRGPACRASGLAVGVG